MAVNLSPVGGVAAQFFDNSGYPLTGGKLYTYAAGTTTPATTYTSSNGATPHSNPIVLDAAGRVPGGEIWLTDGVIYKFVLKTSTDMLIATYDNITGINSNAVAYSNQQDIQTATAGQTVFTLPFSYQPGTNSLSVFVDGVNQYGPGAQYSYAETSSTSVTFNSGLHVGAEVKFTTTQQQGAGAVDASQVSYEPPFTNAVATNVEAKLAQTISIKDFGAVGDGLTDDSAAIQKAYNYIAATGGVIQWPTATYKVDSTIYFSENTKTDLCKSTVLGSGNVSFASGYLSGGVVIANYGTANTCDKASIENGTINNSGGIAFKLTNFRFYCYIKDVVCFNVAQIIVADTCFYSRYENLIYFGAADFVQGTATTTLGSSTVVVTNAIRNTLTSGMEVCSHFAPIGTTISSVGAVDSGGAGLANIVLSANATSSGLAGGINTGFIAALNPKALYDFSTANSDLYFKQCSAGSRFIGFGLNQVNSTTFDSCDIEACGYGFVFTGGSTNNTFNALHTETVFGSVWNCAGNTGGGSMYVHGFNAFNIACVIDTGASGYVDGVINLPKIMPGFTPYGFTAHGEAFVKLTSGNSQAIVIGGGQDVLSNGTGSNVFLYFGGLRLLNSTSNDNQTLDYYKESTWTPVLEGSTSAGVGTYTAQVGSYTRIGNRVFFSMTLAWSAHTGTGNMLISGWPFEPAHVYRAFPAVVSNITVTAGNQVGVQLGGTSFTKADVIQYGNSGVSVALAMDTAGQITLNGNYEV